MQNVGAGRQGSSRAEDIGVAGGAEQCKDRYQPSPAQHIMEVAQPRNSASAAAIAFPI